MQAELRLADAVDRVSRDGVADPRHMHADLVRAAGLEAAAQVRILPVARDDLPVRHGLAAVLLRNGHALAVARVAADGRIDRAAVLAEAAADDALIGAAQRVVAELGGKAPVGKVVLRHDEQAGRVAVDAVDDAGAALAAHAGQAVAAVIEQGVDERAVLVPGGRVDDEALRLIDDEHVPVLIDDIERDILRGGLDGPRLRQGDGVDGPGLRARVFPHGRAAAGHATLSEQALHGAAGQLRQAARQKDIHAQAILRCCEFHNKPPQSRSVSRTSPESVFQVNTPSSSVI